MRWAGVPLYIGVFLALLLFSAACSSGDDDTSPPAVRRATFDRPDEIGGSQVHLIYALPSDATDRGLDTDGTIATSFLAVQRWVERQTDGRPFRLDTFDGLPDVSFFRLGRNDKTLSAEGAFVRDEVEADLRDAGFDAADKIYLVYYGGGSTEACGAGAYPPNLPGNVAILYLYGEPLDGAIQCNENKFSTNMDSAGDWEFISVHELLHTLGFVPTCAPNEANTGHIAGPANDVMYDGEEEPEERFLDPGNDDYFRTDGNCLDFEDSPYLADR